MEDFLGMFKDPLFVAIPAEGGPVAHSRDLKAILDMNDPGHEPHMGAYFTVNGFANFAEGGSRGRTKDNVTSFNCSFLDIDLTPETRRTEAEAILAELKARNFAPTAVVLTGKGLHVYWLYPEPVAPSPKVLSEYEALQTAIVKHYEGRGADRQARDAARVLRLPGTFYYDKQGRGTCETELLHMDKAARYTPRDIARYFSATLPTTTEAGRAVASSADDDGDKFDLSEVLNVKAGSRHRDAYRAALSLIQKARDLRAARQMFQAVVSTWEPPLDWNDYWRQFESARAFVEKDRPQAFVADADKSPVTIQMAADVEMEPVEWLWDGMIAKGKPHMLTGEPGLGKSQITCDIAARLSRGGEFPSIVQPAPEPVPPMGVLILSAEDSASDTMKPRLAAAGADMANIGFINSAVLTKGKDGRPQMRALALKEDAESILHAISLMKVKVGLIIVDPVSAFLSGSEDSNSNSDARSILAQLQAVIMSKGIAMLMINHTNKNTAAKSAHMRSMGSVGWNAAARATFYVFRDQEKDRRVFSVGKTNLAKETGKGFFYDIEEVDVNIRGNPTKVPKIRWNQREFPTKSADEYSAGSERSERKTSDCEDELALFMVGKAEVPSKDGLRHMLERGYSRAEVFRAARKAGIIGEYGVWRSISK